MSFSNRVYASLLAGFSRKSHSVSYLGKGVATLLLLVAATVVWAQSSYVFSGTTAVGSRSTAQAVTVTIQQSGTLNSISVVTQGNPNQDYSNAGGGTCTLGNTYTAGQTCTVITVFSPKYPGIRNGGIVLQNSAGAVLGALMLGGTGTGAVGVMVPGTIFTVAGIHGQAKDTGDGGLATLATLDNPAGVAVDGPGNIYIASYGGNRVRMISAATGNISTLVGNGDETYTGNGGPATQATLCNPTGVAVDGFGNIYIADMGNSAIRKVTVATGIITTVAGTGVLGYTGDKGPATSAELSNPEGIALDTAGNLYIADTLNNVIRVVNEQSSTITIAGVSIPAGDIATIVGTGTATGTGSPLGDGGLATAATLSSPYGVAVDASGNIYIADYGNSRIRKVAASTGVITTVAGSSNIGYAGDGGLATSARLSSPRDVAIDVAGNIYISDTTNNVIRKVNAYSGIIETIVGAVNASSLLNGVPATEAALNVPFGILLDGAGNLYLADESNNLVREVLSNIVSFDLSATPLRVGQKSATQLQDVENDGNASMVFSAVAADANAAIDLSVTTCSIYTPLTPDSNCEVGAQFDASEVSNPAGALIAGNVTLTSNAGNSPLDIQVIDSSVAQYITTTALTSSLNPSTVGQSVTFTAVVTSPVGAATGSVSFEDNGTVLQSVTLNSSATATYTTTALAAGSHPITAVYSGDVLNATSTSSTLTQVVQQATTTTLTASTNPSLGRTAVTFTAAVAALSGTATGNVVFNDSGTAIGAGTLNSSGKATFTTAALAVGTHLITAVYAGDTINLTSTSSALSQVVNADPTTTQLTTSLTPTVYGSAVTFSVTVANNSLGAITGSVEFLDGTTVLGTETLNSSAVAAFSTNALTVGTHSITAVYEGDTWDAVSTSAVVSQVVQLVPTITGLTSSQNPLIAGNSVTFTATITGTAGVAITGSVAFKDGSTTIGTGTVNASGVATFNTTALTPGTHQITAVYTGDADNATSASAMLSQLVTQATTTTGLTSSANPSVIGNTVVLTATVTGTGATPGGTVSFYDGATLLGTVTLTSGVATYSATVLALGQHSITAVYSGDTDDGTSTSSTLAQVVNQATTTTAITSSLNPSPGGISVTFSAAVSTNGSGLTGTVTFKDGTTVLAAVTLATNGSASYTDTLLTVGTHPITAIYSGNTNNATSTGALSQVVQLATTSTVMTATPSPATYGTTVTLTAAVTGNGATPTGTITFKDGAITLGTASLNGVGIASIATSTLAVGSHTLTAAYSGDSLDNSSTSNTVTLSVLPTTTSVLTSNPNPSIAGTAVIFSVTITGSGTTPTGIVTFKDGTNTLGTGTLVSGVATFTTSTLVSGSHSITAVYPGDANNAGNTSAPLTQTVNIATTQTALSAPSTAIAGQSITLTATVTGNGATPTGTVTFKDGATTLGTGSLNASGVATFSLSTLAIGSHTITAVYGGDTNDSTSTSSPSALTVSQATTSTTVVASNNPATAGLPVLFTATVKGNGGTPTGSVIFYDGTTVLSTVTLISGSAGYTAPALAAGTHSITAAYSGDTNDAASTSAILSEIMKQGSTTTSLVTSVTPSDVGSTVTFTATVVGSGAAMTGTVTFYDNAVAIGTGSLSAAGTASYSTASLAVGTHPITATYGGDTNNSGSTSSLLDQVVQQQSSVKVQSSVNPSIAGNSVTFTVNVLGANGTSATGTVTLKDGTSTLTTVTLSGGSATYATSSLLPGTHPITAVYSGDTNNLPSTSAVMSQIVQSASSTLTLTASPTTANFGTAITLTATATGNGSTPTGTITFTDGSVSLGTATLNAGGVATLATTTLSVGQHSIVATYGGDANNGASTSSAAIVRIQQQTSVALTSSLNPSGAGSPVLFTATVSSTGTLMPTGTVTFTDGTTVLGSGTLNTSGVATFTLATLAVGTHSVVASYGGDTLDSGSNSSALAQVVNKNATTLTLAASSNTVSSGSSFTLVAIVASKGILMPTGTVTFLNGITVLGTGTVNSSGVATLVVTLSLGNYSLTSSYNGDSNSTASTSNGVAVSVLLGTDYAMTLNPSSLTMQSGQNATVTVSIQTALNYTDTVAMGCAGLPFAATCTFAQNQVVLKANSLQTVQVVVDTSNPLTSGGSAKNNIASSRLLYCALPGILLLGWITCRRRKSWHGAWRSLALLLIMVSAALAMPGCGSTNYKTTPAGTYTIAVTAVGQSGVLHSATLTLTVK